MPKGAKDHSEMNEREMKKLMKEKAKRRLILRNYFQKQITDPFRPGGTLFDPAILRYHAMKVDNFRFFRPTFKNALNGIVFMVLPMVVYGYFMHKSRTDLESSIRRGEIAYKDRRSKFI